MIIIGVDFHPEFQQVALVDTDTGEFDTFYEDESGCTGLKRSLDAYVHSVERIATLRLNFICVLLVSQRAITYMAYRSRKGEKTLVILW